jgi:hypothetical protein
VSVNFIDQQGKSRLKIDDPVEQIGGTVLYKSKLITPVDGGSYLGLFDTDDETSMFYFQRGYEPEINYLLEIAEPLTRAVLIELGFHSHSVITEANGSRIRSNTQSIPSLKKWNSIFEKFKTPFYLEDVDDSQFSNTIAEELYFEDRIIPVSSKEPWRFHDLSVHPIGHFLISGIISQELFKTTYEVNRDNANRNSGYPSTWYNLDNISEELGYVYVNGKLLDLPSRLVGYIKSIGRGFHGSDLEAFNRNFETPSFIRSMEKEINKQAGLLNSLAEL